MKRNLGSLALALVALVAFGATLAESNDKKLAGDTSVVATSDSACPSLETITTDGPASATDLASTAGTSEKLVPGRPGGPAQPDTCPACPALCAAGCINVCDPNLPNCGCTTSDTGLSCCSIGGVDIVCPGSQTVHVTRCPCKNESTGASCGKGTTNAFCS